MADVRPPPVALAFMALLAFSALPARAVDWSGTLAATSDYVFRGVSQSDGGPALQAGVTAAWDPGWYGSAWASTVEFGPDDDASVELDLLAGWAGDAGKDWTVDVALVHYVYPGESFDDSSELLLSAEWRERLLLSAAWSDDSLATGRPGTYVSAGGRFSLGKEWRLEMLAGTTFAGTLDHGGYAHLEVRAVRAWGSFELQIAGHALESTAQDIFGDAADSRLAVTVTKSFEP